jgi:hypothetical protein
MPMCLIGQGRLPPTQLLELYEVGFENHTGDNFCPGSQEPKRPGHSWLTLEIGMGGLTCALALAKIGSDTSKSMKLRRA